MFFTKPLQYEKSLLIYIAFLIIRFITASNNCFIYKTVYVNLHVFLNSSLSFLTH